MDALGGVEKRGDALRASLGITKATLSLIDISGAFCVSAGAETCLDEKVGERSLASDSTFTGTSGGKSCAKLASACGRPSAFVRSKKACTFLLAIY